MTLLSDIITDAYRQSNLLAIGQTPTTPQNDEGLRYLNRIVKSVFGNEVGDPLVAFPLGRQNISRPSGYPLWGDNPSGEWFVPKNARLMLNLDSAVTVYLPPNPDDGARFAINDVAGTLAAAPLTIVGNGRNIEGLSTIDISDANTNREWFFREDLGDWVRCSPLVIEDALPFPEEFDDFFITMLAIRLNPAYGVALDQQSQLSLQRARNQMRARYKQRSPVRPPVGVSQLPKTVRGRDEYSDYGLDQPSLGDLGRVLWQG